MLNEIILGVLILVTLVLVVMLFRFFQAGGIKTEEPKKDTPKPAEKVEEPPV